MEALSKTSAWDAARVASFLDDYRAPLRLAVKTDSGYPLLCSLWFRHVEGRLLCATQRDAKVVRCLSADPRCAFELSSNETPYFGVRGRGRASISTEGSAELLGELIDRYLETRESSLARWLLSRTQHEVTLAIDVDWLTSWDFTERMES